MFGRRQHNKTLAINSNHALRVAFAMFGTIDGHSFGVLDDTFIVYLADMMMV